MFKIIYESLGKVPVDLLDKKGRQESLEMEVSELRAAILKLEKIWWTKL